MKFAMFTPSMSQQKLQKLQAGQTPNPHLKPGTAPPILGPHTVQSYRRNAAHDRTSIFGCCSCIDANGHLTSCTVPPSHASGVSRTTHWMIYFPVFYSLFIFHWNQSTDVLKTRRGWHVPTPMIVLQVKFFDFEVVSEDREGSLHLGQRLGIKVGQRRGSWVGVKHNCQCSSGIRLWRTTLIKAWNNQICQCNTNYSWSRES